MAHSLCSGYDNTGTEAGGRCSKDGTAPLIFASEGWAVNPSARLRGPRVTPAADTLIATSHGASGDVSRPSRLPSFRKRVRLCSFIISSVCEYIEAKAGNPMNFGHVLVTGGAGFIGSQLVKRLLPVADRISVIDDLSTGNRAAVPPSGKVIFHQDSILNEGLLEQVLPDVTYVFHLACRNLMSSIDNMDSDFTTNLYGGYVLLRKSLQKAVNLNRFIYTSTASVYGNAQIIPTPESHYQIALPYSASKFSMEHYCQAFHHLYQFPVTILRLSNVYGPGQLTSNPYCGVVARFFQNVMADLPLPVFGNGNQTRDFTFIGDALSALLVASRSERALGEIFNVGTGIQTSVNELAERIAKLFRRDDTIIRESKPKRTIDKIEKRAVEIGKIRRVVGWQPEHTLEEGLMITKQWLEEGGL